MRWVTRSIIRTLATVAVVAVVAAVGWSVVHQLTTTIPISIVAPTVTVPAAAQANGQLRTVHTPGTLVADIQLTAGECHYRPVNAARGGVLPDPACTPGAVDPAVTQANIQQTICHRGYTSTVRPAWGLTAPFKLISYSAYGSSHSATTELDHLVPLEVGGASSASNLWVEPNAQSAHTVDNPKDLVEGALNRAVCQGRVPLAAAQQAIATNWITALHQLGLSG
ncbi:MAG: hypothetical protein ABI067_06740 [Leifsonia sp.]